MPGPARQPDSSIQLPALASPNPLATERRVLRTRLSLDECIARLEGETEGGSELDRFITTDRRLRGWVGREKFRVRRFTPDYRNTGRPFVSGTLTRDGIGTSISLTIAPQLGFRIYSLLALVGVVAFAVYSVATGYIWSTLPVNDGAQNLPIPWLIVILTAFLVVLPYVLKRVGMSEGRWLLGFLMTLLEARLDSDGDATT